MSHVRQDTSWCTIDVDTTNGKIVVLERWQYAWLGTPRWTLAEKQRFHARAEREIWSAWSNRAHLRVEGSSDFAKRFRGREIPVFMDIRWVLAKPHWMVEVTKVPRNQLIRSQVHWSSRRIELDSNDFTSRRTCFGPTKNVCVDQVPVAHEFGHTLGNIGAIHPDRNDEYNDGVTSGTRASPYVGDVHSMMHRGNALRERHFDHLLTELYELIADTEFSLGRLQ